MTTPHTPGPWVADGISVHAENGSVKYIARCDYAAVGQDWSGTDYSYRFIQAANARAIAATPELLEACLAMIAWDDREKDHAVDFYARLALCEAAFEKARAAVAKATGEGA